MTAHPNDFKTATTPAAGDGSESSLRKLNRLANQSMSTRGSKAFTQADGATTPADGFTHFSAIQCVQECVFSDLTGNVTNVTRLEGVAIPAGTVLLGLFTTATLTSGLAIGHHA
jgi:hypothetical protein